MDVFGVHRQLIDDYKSFTTSSVTPTDPRIAQHVSEELARGEQWPDRDGGLSHDGRLRG